MIQYSKEKETRQINNNLLNAITPSGGVEFFRNRMMLGENFVKIYGIVKYPPTLNIGWASKLSNLPNVVSVQIFEPVNNGELLASLSASVSRNRGVALSTKNELERQRAERKADDAERLMIQIDQNGEIIGYMSNLYMVLGRDEQVLERSCRQLEASIATLNCKGRLLTNMMKTAFRTISPYGEPLEEVLSLLRRNVPISAFVGGFPFASNSFVDPTGLPFGRNSKGGLVVLDPWMRGNDRTNSNFVVLGVPGVGKSTTVKHLMQNEYMMGTVVAVIDPEREYKELTRNLGGDWINAGGGAFIVNPLQFKQVPLDDEDEDDKEKDKDKDKEKEIGAPASSAPVDALPAPAVMKLYDDKDLGRPGGSGFAGNDSNGSNGVNGSNATSPINMSMALHFKTLEVFFKLYAPEITTRQMALLKLLLEDLYGDFGITWGTDTSKFTAKDFPIMEDLYKMIVKVRTQGKLKNGSELQGIFKDDIFELEVILREMSAGADSFIWNGHSSLDPKSDFICLDTHDLQDTSENVKKAQYYNLLTWMWQRMSRDRDEKVMLFADEAYLLIDPQVPQSLIYMRNMVKRARKYEAGLAVIFHSVVDVLDPSIKMYGQALLDTPAYKILMGTDGVNLIETAKIYNLTQSEQEKLANKQRGVSVFFAGNRRFVVNHEMSEYELANMGRGGGR